MDSPYKWIVIPMLSSLQKHYDSPNLDPWNPFSILQLLRASLCWHANPIWIVNKKSEEERKRLSVVVLNRLNTAYQSKIPWSEAYLSPSEGWGRGFGFFSGASLQQQTKLSIIVAVQNMHWSSIAEPFAVKIHVSKCHVTKRVERRVKKSLQNPVERDVPSDDFFL